MKIEVNTTKKIDPLRRRTSGGPGAFRGPGLLLRGKEIPGRLSGPVPDHGHRRAEYVLLAAGSAREGYRPFLHTFAVFLYRRILDQLEMSVAYPNLPVVFVGFVPGITTPGGVTHQSINDVGVLRDRYQHDDFLISATPQRSRASWIWPGSGRALSLSVCCGRKWPRLFPADQPMEFNRARVLSRGDDILILSSSICTEEAMRATQALKEKGLSIQAYARIHPEAFYGSHHPGGSEEDEIRSDHHRKPVRDRRSFQRGFRDDRGKRHRLPAAEDRPAGYPHGASKMYLMKKYGIDAPAPGTGRGGSHRRTLRITEADLAEERFVDFLEV